MFITRLVATFVVLVFVVTTNTSFAIQKNSHGSAIQRKSSSHIYIATPQTPTNICIGGKAVPQFYLLGQHKCGSTTMARELFASGITANKRNHSRKETHSIDQTLCDWTMPSARTSEHWSGVNQIKACRRDWKAVKSWTDQFDINCSLFARGRQWSLRYEVFSDMTPLNLRLPGLPSALSEIYGRHARRLVFAVILREPLRRMQSAHYFIQRDVLMRGAQDAHDDYPHAGNFTHYVNYLKQRVPEFERKGWDGIEYDFGMDSFYRSMYSLNLKRWLDSFHAEQFIITPMFAHFKNNLSARQDTMNLIFGKLGAEATPLSEIIAGKNGDPHPPLEDDISSEDLMWLQKFYDEDTNQLSQLLSENIKQGLLLKGYAGEPKAEYVKEYLLLNW